MPKVAFHNLGCKVNAYEIEVMQQLLQEMGYDLMPFEEGADVYVINTCSVTNIADRKSRQMLHKAKKMNPDAVVVAVGCYVQTGLEQVELDPDIDLAIGNNKKAEIGEILKAFLMEREGKAEQKEPFKKSEVLDINHTSWYEEMQLKQTAEHTRAYIKIQDGCNQFCSYCIIPYARGRVRSRKEEDVLEEITNLVQKGFKEVVITGIHLSSYGLDFLEKESKEGDYLGSAVARKLVYEKEYLLHLLEKMDAIEGLQRIRIGSLEPRIITEKFVTGLQQLKHLCPHFHLSLQSGCDATLQRMNRHYSAAEYQDKVKILREFFPKAAITTDVIVGFPGETEEEFAISKAFLEQVQFYEAHIFKYSKRQGTVAAARKDQIPEKEKTKRSSMLLELTKEQSIAYRESFLGEEVEVLIEEEKEIDGKVYQVGFTTHYVKAAVEKSVESNQIIRGKAEKLLAGEYLLLEVNGL